MSDKTVKFTINIGGNAVSGVAKLSEKVDALDTIAGRARNTLERIGNLGMRLSGVIQSAQALVAKAREFTDAYNAQIEAEAKLEQVMRNTMGARASEIQSINDLARAQQKLGVIGAEVQLAGAQELGTYLTKAETLRKLMPVMNDMLAQQYGLNASQEQATQIASMLGKVMDGQVGAFSRYGYKFDEVQEKILKFGNEEQRAKVLADVVSSSVGGMNRRLALTNAGRAKQLANNMGDLKEQVGALATKLRDGFIPAASSVLSKVQALVEVPLPQKIAQEKAELNALVGALIDASDKEDERKSLIDELQAKYPDFIKNIDLEKATTQDLVKALKEANAEYDNRIRKAALERRLQEYDEKAGDAMDDIVSHQLALQAQQERPRIAQEIEDKLKEYEKQTGRHYIWSRTDHKVYRQKGSGHQSMQLPHNLGDEREAVLQALIDEYDAYGDMLTTWGNDEKKLKKSRREYLKYTKGREALQKAIGREYGTPSTNSETSSGTTQDDTTDNLTNQITNAATSGATAAVTGGTRNTTVNINLGKMVENVVFNGTLGDNAQELENRIMEILTRTLTMAAATA